MLQIKRQDSKTWDENADELLELWASLDTVDDDDKHPESVLIGRCNGQWCLWSNTDGESSAPKFLDPALYSVTNPNSIPREEVKRVLEEVYEGIEATGSRATALEESDYLASHATLDQIASALNLTLTAHSTSDTRKDSNL